MGYSGSSADHDANGLPGDLVAAPPKRIRVRGRRRAESDALWLLESLVVLLLLVAMWLDRAEELPAPAFTFAFILGLAATTIWQRRAGRRRRHGRGDLLLVADQDGLTLYSNGRAQRGRIAWADLSRLEVGVPRTRRRPPLTRLSLDGDNHFGPAWAIHLEGPPADASTAAIALMRLDAEEWRRGLPVPDVAPASTDETIWQLLEGCDVLARKCDKCGYLRTGISPRARCPECGERAPGNGVPLLRGAKRVGCGCAGGSALAWYFVVVGILTPLMLASIGGLGCLLSLLMLLVPLVLVGRAPAAAPFGGSWLLDPRSLVISNEPAMPIKVPWAHVLRAAATRPEGSHTQVEVQFAAIERAPGVPDRPRLARTILRLKDDAAAGRIVQAIALRVRLDAISRADQTAPQDEAPA